MIFRNDTDLPDEALHYLIRFVDPDDFLLREDGGEIVITNQDQDDTGERNGVFLPWKGPDVNGYGPTGKIVIFKGENEPIEYLVSTLAHEFRHMWQWYHDWKLFNDKEASEKDADEYAESIYLQWFRAKKAIEITSLTSKK